MLEFRQPELKSIESFCGAGGMSLGLSAAGYKINLAFDNNAKAIETYTRNISDHGKVLDACVVTGCELLELAGISSGELDLFSGGPPCQGFSKQRRGAHLLQDPRNHLVLDYARLVLELQPKAFVFENVEVFGQKRGANLVKEVKAQFEGQYFVYTYFVCASDFGLAQRRSRFIMIGIRRDVSTDVPVLYQSGERATIRSAIGDLPVPPEDYSEHPDLANHIKCRISAENERRIACVPPGGGWQDIPMELRLPCHQVETPKAGGWPDVYGRLEWEGQCPTLTAGFDSFSRGRYGHPEQDRSLTLREGARLQGFPDDFRFYGNRGDIRLQIGNAVPPPLAKAVGDAVRRVLAEKEPDSKERIQWPKEREERSIMESQLTFAV